MTTRAQEHFKLSFSKQSSFAVDCSLFLILFFLYILHIVPTFWWVVYHYLALLVELLIQSFVNVLCVFLSTMGDRGHRGWSELWFSFCCSTDHAALYLQKRCVS